MKDKEAPSQNKFYWAYLIGFFLILTLPLFSAPPWFYPPAWGKTIVFRIILSTLIFLFIWQILFQKSNRFSTIAKNILDRKNRIFWLFWLLVALLVIFFLATIFSLELPFSFWGDPERSGGSLNFSFYIIFAILGFLILQKKDWQKVWNFSILVGILVSLVAISQQFHLFEKFVVPYGDRPPSTLGNSIFLAIYLLLLSFPALSFGIKSKSLIKKLFYFSSFLLFLSVAVFITQTRAIFIGLAAGLLYFLFFYPAKKSRLSLGLKVATLFFLILGTCGLYYINTQPDLSKIIKENKILEGVISRLSIERALKNPRISSWKISQVALKNKPIFGYGPENYSIAFDKYYDPSLPSFRGPDWWDRAHNFVFDISVTAGIPALIIYLSLFGVLFFQLQKLKNADRYADSYAEKRPNKIVYHGIQATFIAYLTANFFSFDTFSTYLISFLLIGYSLHLISLGAAEQSSVVQRKFSDKIIKWKRLILAFLLVILVWFIWSFNLKPFQINKEISSAIFYSKKGYCEKALEIMEKILPSHSILDNYLRLKNIGIIKECIKNNPERELELSKKAIQLLKESAELRSSYTRSWLLLGTYTTVVIEKEQGLSPEFIKKLKKEADFYFEKAQQLSPKRQQILLEWIKTDLVVGEYEKAKEKSQKCIDLNPNLGSYWWLMGLTQAYLKDYQGSDYSIEMAEKKHYRTETEDSLLQLTKAYIKTENYPGLAKIYLKLISINPTEPQYHASLADVYQKLGEFEKAKKEALKVLELQPESKASVEEFLKSLEK